MRRILPVLLSLIFCLNCFAEYLKPPRGIGNNPKRNLVGCWLFNEGSGNTVQDLSGNGNTGTLGSASSWVGGTYGPAAYLPGSGANELTVADSTTLQIFSSFTFVLDYSTTDTTNIAWAEKDGTNFYTSMATATQIRFRHAQIGDGTTIVTIGNTWNDGNRHQIVLTWDGVNTAVYFDGIYKGGEAATGTMDLSGATLKLGAVPVLAYYANITINFLAIYNRDLSVSEISKHYREPFCMFKEDLPVAMMYDYSGAPAPTGQVIMITSAIPILAISLLWLNRKKAA